MKIARVRRVAIGLLVFVTALVSGVTVYLYSVRARPVVYGYFEKGNPVHEPAFAIFNPFRNRSPERQADAFLEGLKEGRCEQTLSGLYHEQEYRREVCGREKKSPLLDWRLTNRTDETNKVRMYYEVKRKTYKGYTGQLWITLEKRADDWQITEYECFY